jgi:hypothetical protein
MVKIKIAQNKEAKIFSRPHATKSTRENDIYANSNYPAAGTN